MKICLVQPGSTHSSFRAIPLGLLSICATLKHAGHECAIRDCNVDDSGDTGLEYYDVVGISVMSTQLQQAIQIADRIKDRVTLVWGGIHCLLDPQSLLAKYPQSFVVSGEGETPLLNLVEALADDNSSLPDIEGVSSVRNGEFHIAEPFFMKDLDGLPDLDYYDLPHLERYIDVYEHCFGRSMKALPVLTGRGCPWNCWFCINSIFHECKGFRRRERGVAQIARETSSVIEEFGIEVVTPRDDDFFAGRKMLNEWMDFTRDNNLLWSANCRYNYLGEKYVDAQKLQELQRSGCYSLGMSIEAGIEEIRNGVLNKCLKDEDIRRGVDVIKDSQTNIAVNTSFVAYFPGDTSACRIENIKWMDYLSRNINIMFSGPQVYRSYPGSRLYKQEGDHVYGNLDYYLNSMQDSGEFREIHDENGDSVTYFTSMIRDAFNKRFRLLDLPECGRDDSGEAPGQNDDATAKVTGNLVSRCIAVLRRKKLSNIKYRIYRVILAAAFALLRGRLSFNFWTFFVEPRFVGNVFRRYST